MFFIQGNAKIILKSQARAEWKDCLSKLLVFAQFFFFAVSKCSLNNPFTKPKRTNLLLPSSHAKCDKEQVNKMTPEKFSNFLVL